jgi:hypothetical protein
MTDRSKFRKKPGEDETAYLLRSPANAERLRSARLDIKRGRVIRLTIGEPQDGDFVSVAGHQPPEAPPPPKLPPPPLKPPPPPRP